MNRTIKQFIVAFFLFLSLGKTTQAFANLNHNKYLMGYLTFNLMNDKELQEKVDILDILAYAFLSVDKKGFVVITSNKKLFKPDNFENFLKLQNKSAHFIKLVSIGGAGSDNSFHYALNQPSHFINSISIIINRYQLGGVDLDFEPNTIFTSQQAQNYANLIQALRIKLGNSVFISMTVPPDIESLNSMGRKYWKKIISNINLVSIMDYDFHTAFYLPLYTGYNSNLYSDSNEPNLSGYYHISADQSIKYLTFLGVPAEKIMLGFPSYGLSYGGVSAQQSGLFQPFDDKLTPTYDEKGKGRLLYKTIPALLKEGFKEHISYNNNHISSVWAYNSNTRQFITYDNQNLITEKALYVKRNHLAGLMTWAINYDVPVKNKYSLLSAAKKGLE